MDRMVVPGTDLGPWTVDQFCDGLARTIYVVRCVGPKEYVGNNLNDVLALWAANGQEEVRSVQQIG